MTIEIAKAVPRIYTKLKKRFCFIRFKACMRYCLNILLIFVV